MCITCGCGTDSAHIVKSDHHQNHNHHDQNHDHTHTNHGDHDHHHHNHNHSHGVAHGHHHDNVQAQDVNGRLIHLERDVLHENALLAARNSGYLDAKKIFAINLVSSPGSGKTMLLERTLTDLKEELSFNVIEGDQHTTVDADRIKATGTNAVQINTGKGCHLDAHMVLHAIQEIEPKENTVLFIENVGNLVCPSMFDLGESERVVIISVTEGDDKPLKYPDMFHTSGVCIINKTDLLPYVPFDCNKLIENAKKINPNLTFFRTSCTSGEGLNDWYDWLKNQAAKLRKS
jgi:hydrogenase nickel incorporation protein HypB